MADVKISQLPAATTPLDGTELTPIVQSGTTKRVSVANLTVGRALTASSLTLSTPLSAANGGTGVTTSTGTGSVVLSTTPTFTTSALFPAGTVGAPGISVSGDTNTGIYFPAADTIGFVEGGVEAMRLDSSGRLTVGATTYSGLDVGQLAQFNAADIAQTSGGGIVSIGSTSTAAANLGGTLAFTANTGQAVAHYTVARLAGRLTSTSNYGGYLQFETTDSAGAYQERMRIDASGNLLVGTTSSSTTTVGWKFLPAVNGSAFVCDTTGDGPTISFTNINATIANGYRWFSFRINSGGTQAGSISYNTGTSQVNYNQTSDRRIKSNITPALPVLEKMKQVEVVSFDMGQGHTDYGVIAQDLHKLFPEAVSVGDDLDEPETLWGFAGASLVPAMVKAIQELAAKVSALEAKQ